jgi:cell division protein ZapA
MVKKNSAEVLINGKIYTISGYESKAYLQKVASYLNQMEEEITGTEGYRRLSTEEKQLLKNMNLADSYFKECEAREALEQEKEQKDKEIYDLKHDLVDARMELDKLKAQIQELEAQLQEEQKRQSRIGQSASSRKISKQPERKL